MPDLDGRVEQDAAACRDDPHAKFNVLDARPAVAGVEAAVLQERLASDRAAAAPERSGVAGGHVVRVVMLKILPSTDHVPIERLIVVAAEDGVDVFAGSERSGNAADGVACDLAVGVDEEDDGRLHLLHARVSSDGRACVLCHADEARTRFVAQLG